MEIKESGKKWLLIRSNYIPVQRDEEGNKIKGTGRNSGKTIASIPKDAAELETKAILSEVDLTEQELRLWVEHDQRVKSAEVIKELTSSIGFVTRHVKRISTIVAATGFLQVNLDQMQVELWKMKKALKKAKYGVLNDKRCKELAQNQESAKQKSLF